MNGEIHLIDQERAVSYIMEFLNDETSKVLLLKGYDNEAKLKVALACLNREFLKGIVRTSAMSNISKFINSAFDKDLLPQSVKSTRLYNIGKMTVQISSYATHTSSNPKGNSETFTLIHPVQTVLDDSKRYKKFLEELNDTASKKIILITTNEWGIRNWDIENHVDSIFFYEVENDNPQLMENLRRNKAL